jgi:hypothetical protein
MKYFKIFLKYLLKALSFLLFVVWTLFIKPNLWMIVGYTVGGVLVITGSILGIRALVIKGKAYYKNKNAPKDEMHILEETEEEKEKTFQMEEAMKEVEDDLNKDVGKVPPSKPSSDIDPVSDSFPEW